MAANGAVRFSVRGFGHAPFYIRMKDDYEKGIVFGTGDGDGGWYDADDGVCCEGNRRD